MKSRYQLGPPSSGDPHSLSARRGRRRRCSGTQGRPRNPTRPRPWKRRPMWMPTLTARSAIMEHIMAHGTPVIV